MGSVTLLALTTMLALGGITGGAAGYTPGCGQIPIVGGIPPWGFHTGPPVGATGSFARGHGEIDLEASTVSGIICQEQHFRDRPTRAITMTVERHLVYHSHYAVMWGYPGNIMKIVVRVRASNDPRCEVGTVGHATLFASYSASAATASSSSSRLPAGIRTTSTTEPRSTTRFRRCSVATL